MAERRITSLHLPLRRPSAGARLAALAAALVLPPAAGASAAPLDISAPCLNAPLAQGHVVDVRASGDLVLADGTVLRLAGLAGGGAGAAVSWRDDLAARVLGHDISFAVKGARDRYGRRAALVGAPGASVAPASAEVPTLQQALLREGLALARPEDGVLGCFPFWLKAEENARRERRGLWRHLPLAADDIDALRARQGRFTIVAGRILDVGNTSRVDYLNFGRVWRQDMTGRVEAEGRAALAARELTAKDLVGRWVRLRGTVFEAGGPAITLRRAEQIEIARAGVQKSPVVGTGSGAEGHMRPTGDE